jgi:hypothetical protein
MSGNFNSSTNVSFTAVNFQVVSPTLTTESFSGKVRRIGQGHQYYTFEVKLPPLTPYQFGPVAAFLAGQYGQVDSFTIQLPYLSYNTGANGGVIGSPATLTGGAATAVGSKSVNIGYMTTNKAQTLRAGDYFKFANHSKVYMAIADLNSGASGQGTLNFAGSLVEAVPNGTAIIHNDVPFNVIMDSDVQEYSLGSGGMTQYQFKCREVW